MPKRKATLFVRFLQEGFHCWPDAPDGLAYLRARHRHLFHIEVRIRAPIDGKRSVEFHSLIEHCRTVLRDCSTRRGPHYDFGDMSCEQIADTMAQRISRVYGEVVGVSVCEDGEAGALVYVDGSEVTDV